MPTNPNTFTACVSDLEKSQRLSVYFFSGCMWVGYLLIGVTSMGIVFAIGLVGWLIAMLLAEYNVRKVQALGVTVSERQFPEVHQALAEVCAHFQIAPTHRVIVLNHSATNAFAIKFARKRVIVIYTELLEGIIDQPAQLRALLAHELCHCVLDHGWRGMMELYKPAKYRQGRELTCDNAGYAASGSLEDVKQVLRRLAVGNRLCGDLDEAELVAEAQYLQKGFYGWLLRQHLSHPPVGTRIQNVTQFAQACG